MARKNGQITQADCYINEVDVCGRVTELDMGEIAHAEVEHQTLGMIGVLKLPGRRYRRLRVRSVLSGWMKKSAGPSSIQPRCTSFSCILTWMFSMEKD